MNLKDSNSKISDDNVKNDIQRSIDASSPLSELSHEEKEIEVKPEKKKSISENRNIKTPENSQLQWKRGEPIGQGTFGTVYKGLNERTGELLAIKEICLVDGSESDVKELRKEISIMWDLDHENIVRYIGTAQTERYLYIIIEYISGGSIASMLAQFGAFSENLVRRFTHQVLCGVEYLHAKGIIHRDIKGANVLVTESGVAKLADFGCSKQLVGMCTASFEESLRAIRGSVPWMAPEIIKQEGHGRSSDIWSVGATVIEMATGKPPWPEFKDNLAALFHVATSKEPPPPPSHVSKYCAKFISQCMAIDAKDRLSAKELLEHDPFMKSDFELNTTSSYSTVPTELSDSPVSPARSAYENSLALSMQS
jgi:mitogen-activated protein kinase kinase kinase